MSIIKEEKTEISENKKKLSNFLDRAKGAKKIPNVLKKKKTHDNVITNILTIIYF